jgi:hypothetical protein
MKRDNVQVDKGSSTVFGGDRKRVKLETPELEFPILNQSDPAHARRIQQRRRMVSDSVEALLTILRVHLVDKVMLIRAAWLTIFGGSPSNNARNFHRR